mmetsp:Transcript_20801/g.57872  ORF Transcript_20801/g.57872 Transcript_20801/m.57872 type:complete len:227 (-) Transcript_20801:16-696(-)
MAGADVRVGHQGQLPQIHLRRGFGEALDGQVERLLGVGIQLAEAADDAAQIQQLSTLHQRRRELHGEPPQKALVALLRPRHRRQHQRGLLRRQRVRDDVRAGHELPPDARVPGAVRSDALEEPRERRAARPRDAREGVLRHGLRPCLRDPRRGGGRGGGRRGRPQQRRPPRARRPCGGACGRRRNAPAAVSQATTQLLHGHPPVPPACLTSQSVRRARGHVGTPLR